MVDDFVEVVEHKASSISCLSSLSISSSSSSLSQSLSLPNSITKFSQTKYIVRNAKDFFDNNNLFYATVYTTG